MITIMGVGQCNFPCAMEDRLPSLHAVPRLRVFKKTEAPSGREPRQLLLLVR